MKRTFKKGMAVTMTAAMMMSLAACGSSALLSLSSGKNKRIMRRIHYDQELMDETKN